MRYPASASWRFWPKISILLSLINISTMGRIGVGGLLAWRKGPIFDFAPSEERLTEMEFNYYDFRQRAGEKMAVIWLGVVGEKWDKRKGGPVIYGWWIYRLGFIVVLLVDICLIFQCFFFWFFNFILKWMGVWEIWWVGNLTGTHLTNLSNRQI